MILLVDG